MGITSLVLRMTPAGAKRMRNGAYNLSVSSVAEFVRALALAWKNLAAYPPGHPALNATLDMAHRRLDELRGPAGDVIFGIAADGLVYGEEKLDSPQAQKFAQALYQRNVAVLRIGSQTAPTDIDTFLRVLGTGVQGSGRPIWEEVEAAGVRNISLQPVDYSAVRVTEEMVEPPKKATTTLWEEILKALMNDRELSPTARQLLSSVRTIDELAALIMRQINDAGHDSEAEFDPDATFGIRLTTRVPETEAAVTERVASSIGAYVQGSGGMKRQLAVQQILQLLRCLPDPLRQAVIRAVMQTLATDPAAAALLKEFAGDLHRDEILEALRSLPQKNLSTHAAMLLNSLAMADRAQSQGPAPAAIVAELAQLFGDEDIDRFNPPDHRSLLETVSIDIPRLAPGGDISRLGDRVETVSEEAVNRTATRTLLDLIGRFGVRETPDAIVDRLEQLFRASIGGGRVHDALEVVRELKMMQIEGAKKALARMASPETMRMLIDALVSAPPEKAGGIALLLEGLGEAALDSLLIALAEESNRSRRRRLFDFVSSLGPRIIPAVRRFLSDDRWFVLRNMILLLRSVNDRTSLPDMRQLAAHPDMRVRLEAIKTLIALEPAVPRALLESAINDPDPKLAEHAITLAGSYGIREAVEPLLRVIERRKALRVRAIRALGDLSQPEALPHLERFFREPFWPWSLRAERRAAYESLASYPVDARAPFVERGLRSRDAHIREVCRKMS
jgi:HEAT repeat protein